MPDTTILMWGLLFGSIGMGYLMYGKSQRHMTALLSGIGLCALPYILTNAILLVVLGVVMMAVPYFVKV